MYKLIQVSDRGCCIQSPAKIGLVRLEGQTGRRIYMPGIECAFTRRLILEPSFCTAASLRHLPHKILSICLAFRGGMW